MQCSLFLASTTLFLFSSLFYYLLSISYCYFFFLNGLLIGKRPTDISLRNVYSFLSSWLRILVSNSLGQVGSRDDDRDRQSLPI